LLQTPVERFDPEGLAVNDCVRATEAVISTVPWPELARAGTLPPQLEKAVASLHHASIEVSYRPEFLEPSAHWTYVPDEAVPHHRIVNRATFCPASRGYWTEMNTARSGPVPAWRHVNQYAYPLNTRNKPGAIDQILRWAAGMRIFGLGRWGQWEHLNSDLAVEAGLAMAAQLAGTPAARARHDINNQAKVGRK
jgi:hypothetical protein